MPSRSYVRWPGHAVEATSRWPMITGSEPVQPGLRTGCVLPSRAVSTVVPRGSRANVASFHAATWATERSAASGGVVPVKSPMIAMPMVFVLKPPECTPSGIWSIEPLRPSYTVPNRSTRKWYPTSLQPRPFTWYS